MKSLKITPSISFILTFAVLSLLLILAECTVLEKGPVRVALAQTVCIDGDRSGNFVRIENAVIEAKEHGAHLVTFPETSILGWVNPEAHEKACPIPGSDTDRLCELAKKYSIMLSIGLAEKDGDHLYDSAILIDEKGKILLKHRKINTLDELMSPPYTPGNQIQAVNTALGRMGMLICADSFKPELLEQLKVTKPDLVIIPYGWAANETDWPHHGKALHKVVRNVAQKTGCPVIGTDLVGQITHGPWTGMTFGGQSVAVDAAGRILAVGKDRDRDLLLIDLKIQ